MFFLSFFCMAFWRSFGFSWAAPWYFENLSGWFLIQKRGKTRVFYNIVSSLFKVRDGSFGLIVDPLVICLWFLCKNPGPFCVSFLALAHFNKRYIIVLIKKHIKKRWSIFGIFFVHFWSTIWGLFWRLIGHRGGKMRPREMSGVSNSQKYSVAKGLKNLLFF